MKRFLACSLLTVSVLTRCVGGDDGVGDGGADASADVATDVNAIDAPADVTADVSPQAACTLSKPFGTPVALPAPFNAAGDHGDLWLSSDLLTAWFDDDVTADGGTQTLSTLYWATRTNFDAGLTGFTNVIASGINSVGTGYGVDGPSITSDGLTMYFGNGFTNGYTAWTATRATTTVDFSNPTELPAPINGSGTENTPCWISPSGTTLYFMSNRTGGVGNRDIWTATRSGNGAFINATPLNTVNTAGDDASIVLTPDELQAFVMRGNTSVFYTSRTTITDGFATPQAITELNTFASQHKNQMYPSLASPDGCTLYFSSNTGPAMIYSATRGL